MQLSWRRCSSSHGCIKVTTMSPSTQTSSSSRHLWSFPVGIMNTLTHVAGRPTDRRVHPTEWGLKAPEKHIRLSYCWSVWGNRKFRKSTFTRDLCWQDQRCRISEWSGQRSQSNSRAMCKNLNRLKITIWKTFLKDIICLPPSLALLLPPPLPRLFPQGS